MKNLAPLSLALALTLNVWAAPIVFPSLASTYNTSTGNNPAGAFFEDTHFVSETFTLAGLASVNTASFTFQMQDFGSNTNAPVNFDVLINAVTIGSYTAFVAPLQNFNLNFSFADIAAGVGSTYTVTFQETNNVPGGLGAVRFVQPGSGDLSNAPEMDPTGAAVPLTFLAVLLATGLTCKRRTRVVPTH